MSTTNTSGRRKTAVARIYLTAGNGNIIVNGKDYKVYFPTLPLQYVATQSLLVAESLANFDIKVNVSGGGETGQAGAVRHGVTRALIDYDAALKPTLSKAGLVTRDAREVERKKVGLHGARRRKQFSKR